MSTPCVLPDPSLVRTVKFKQVDGSVVIESVACSAEASCPKCGMASTRVHSRYSRSFLSLSWGPCPVRVVLTSRRWHCANSECSQRIFTERLPGLIDRYQRRSPAVSRILLLLAYSMGCEAGARTGRSLGLQVSPDTLIRMLIAASEIDVKAPKHLGVDDFAFRRGREYGTLLVDLDTGQPIDMLKDRESETFRDWLLAHPGANVVSRDCSQAYADGIRKGAPDATQVADRFHLTKNLIEALTEQLRREQSALDRAARAPEPQGDPAVSGVETPPGVPSGPDAETSAADSPLRTEAYVVPGEKTRSEEKRDARKARYDEMIRLRSQGFTIAQITERTGLSRGTIVRWLRAGEFPERRQRARSPKSLDEYRDYLKEQWDGGIKHGGLLYEDLKSRGYRGSRSALYAYVSGWRNSSPEDADNPPKTVHPPPKTWTWKLLKGEEDLTESEVEFKRRLYEDRPEIRIAMELAGDFLGKMRGKDGSGLESWLELALKSGIRELVTFARGLKRHWAAVKAAFTQPWSNGVLEGNVNRLKMIKRTMYGRGGRALLRARVLPLA